MNAVPLSERRVYIVDDDESVRTSLEWTLRMAEYHVVSFARATDFLQNFEPSWPSCLLLDLYLPDLTGSSLCQNVLAMEASCGIIMMSGHGDLHTAVELMRLGALDFLEKPCNRNRLLAAIQRAANRHREMREEADMATRLKSLSAREQEIFDALASGLITKQIAQRLGISASTVNVHRANISRKLRIDSPTQMGHVMYLQRRYLERKGSVRSPELVED